MSKRDNNWLCAFLQTILWGLSKMVYVLKASTPNVLFWGRTLRLNIRESNFPRKLLPRKEMMADQLEGHFCSSRPTRAIVHWLLSHFTISRLPHWTGWAESVDAVYRPVVSFIQPTSQIVLQTPLKSPPNHAYRPRNLWIDPWDSVIQGYATLHSSLLQKWFESGLGTRAKRKQEPGLLLSNENLEISAAYFRAQDNYIWLTLTEIWNSSLSRGKVKFLSRLD